MTDKTTDQTYSVLDDMDDLELITRMLNGQLDPERIEAVRRRLAEDPEFRDLAAPLLLTWTVPPHIERNPRPDGEWERDWSEFTKRTGFGEPRPETPSEPPPRKKRVRWGRRLLLIFGGLFVYVFILPPLLLREDQPDYSPVPYDTGWIALNDGVEVRLEPGASLFVAHRFNLGSRRVKLVGSARFRVWPIDTTTTMLRGEGLRIETAAGVVRAGESDFSITAKADTTLIYVHPLARRRRLPPQQESVTAATRYDRTWNHVSVGDLEGARLVKGHDPQRIFPNR